MEYYDIVRSEKVHCATQVCVKIYFVIAKYAETCGENQWGLIAHTQNITVLDCGKQNIEIAEGKFLNHKYSSFPLRVQPFNNV